MGCSTAPSDLYIRNLYETRVYDVHSFDGVMNKPFTTSVLSSECDNSFPTMY